MRRAFLFGVYLLLFDLFLFAIYFFAVRLGSFGHEASVFFISFWHNLHYPVDHFMKPVYFQFLYYGSNDFLFFAGVLPYLFFCLLYWFFIGFFAGLVFRFIFKICDFRLSL